METWDGGGPAGDETQAPEHAQDGGTGVKEEGKDRTRHILNLSSGMWFLAEDARLYLQN